MGAPDLFYPVPTSGSFHACKKCPALITFVKTDKGKLVPLDLSMLRPRSGIAEWSGVLWEARTHYQDCPEAAAFARKR